MIDFTFHTVDGPILIQLCTPVATQDALQPWAIEVMIDGRPSIILGENPLEVLGMGSRFAASYLSGREGLDPAVNDLPWGQAPDLLAQGFREGIVAVLEVREIACPEAARERLAACADPVVLQRFLVRAKSAVSVDEVLAP